MPSRLSKLAAEIDALDARRFEGRVTGLSGALVEASGPMEALALGARAIVHGAKPTQAEIVGFRGDRALLAPYDSIEAIRPGMRVSLEAAAPDVRPTQGWLGRVVNCFGDPVDGEGPLPHGLRAHEVRAAPPSAHDRARVGGRLDVGVRALNIFSALCRGQRMGVFAGSGVGKSVLMSMLARGANADVIVIGLVGERGREVKEFIEDILGEDGRQRSVVVAAPADAPPLVRMQGATYATAIAEHFRDKGLHVLLLMDSLTRYAMAQREIALAIGEPPATKGYPPSVFAKLPQLVERSGNGMGAGSGQGSITAFYTVLTEGDDPQDPIADAARGILDGHIVLSRELAEGGHFPAIDVEKSVSRVMTSVAAREHQLAARRMRQLLAKVNKARDLIQLGAYQPGHDAELDLAVKLHPQMVALLQQDQHSAAPLDASRAQLARLVAQSQ